MQQVTRDNLGFLLAKASQRWNDMLYERFYQAGYSDVRPNYGSILLPLFEQDGLQMGELARRASLSKQTLTTLVRAVEGSGLVRREQDPLDRRAYRIYLTERAHSFRPIATRILDELDAAVAASFLPEQLAALRGMLRILMNLQLNRSGGNDEIRHEDHHD
jgi:DNA-binding MarR family transcriptional regulator